MLDRFRDWKFGCLAKCFTYIGQPLLSLCLATCQVEVRGWERFKERVAQKPTVMLIWHNRLSMVISILKRLKAYQFRYAAVVSRSRDGKLLADVISSYRQARAIRVANTARHQGLRASVQAVKGGEIVLITPDGPRGPCYKIKPGILFTARQADAQVLPLTWTCNKYWELGSWDRMRFPKPFSKVLVQFGSALSLENEDDKACLREWEKELARVEEELEQSLAQGRAKL